ncbi:MAG: HAMP domain-containing histidine kinase, partial [Clostridia bacterium]|nr:HAMP domain-containing histidine kinase [Clostridia bacterium]
MKFRKKQSVLGQRFSLLYISLTIIFLTMFNHLQFEVMDDIFFYAAKQSLITVADKMSKLDYKSDTFQSEMSDLEASNSVYVEIYYPRDRLVYTSDTNKAVYSEENKWVPLEKLQPRVMKLVSQEMYPDGSYFEIRQEFFTTAEFLVYGDFFSENTAIELYYSTDLIRGNATTASWALLALSLSILFAAFVGVSIVSKMYLDPVVRIKNTTEKMAKLNFKETCPTFKNKELRELSDNINFLSASLSKSLQELKTENRKLESDIENERKQEKVRRSFVANASHELKTPISIIRGYAEGIKFGIGADSTEEFCDVIIEESDKMNNLIVRLMEQLQYSSTYTLNESSFSVKDFVTDLVNGHRLDYDECNIKLSVDIPEDFMGRGDTDLLSSVFNNYFSNALSHIDFDRKLIISCRDVQNAYRISVYNSGKPISGTDIENIWQSFYRADKAHSRSEGRFGLGLSIVSTIQDLHKQKYGVINKEHGVEFWFDIKKAEKA